ncbi:cupin domain-containing protein [Caballeronia sp. LZ062]|uniref:cupin domain-containing protein n=1 Tax=unclassified Caballeronia TaxID=2646786 RepID=UPI0028600D2E|nr:MULTISPECIES: cupin domain-containing protein [unclassified Caballeronia]MDR5856372.1 cupin domain-containing protein [Caballeronia sp. LZ050]MDR5873042.1 cupin domain-containing protein [Caballeronia sp. LZ062]
MVPLIDLESLADTPHDGYLNRIIGTVNDHDIHISVMTAPYEWHLHPDSDETFIVTEGTLVIDFEDGTLDVRAGQMLTIPAGARHRTRPKGARSVNLTLERKDTRTVFCDDPKPSE